MSDAGPVARAAELAALGHHTPLDAGARDQLLAALDDDPDPRVRSAAIGALVRAEPGGATGSWLHALGDTAPAVRRRAAELAPALPVDARIARALVDTLADDDVTVVEAVAWSLGELGDTARTAGAVPALADVTRAHHDALAREAAVAALGALGDHDALPAILDACRDKPAVRRRAVLALAPFEGPEVDAALDAALTDRDWQVRQAAEDLRD
ncbi:MAG TPA: HEAT repeat domain-containing protein [Acidimicrobiia bacterium]